MATKGEKILVSVRVRPRNDKEKTRNDICDWECVNDTTIICNNNLPERSLFPSTYTFDRVFGFDSQTKQVYEDGAKEVALCVLGGINSSIFAYGQTSSGKTYTMSGITEFAMDDIFAYIQKHKDREFTLKFSAIEIYNEAVRDLLSGDNNPLRLLDDPERGTVVEKLIEETLRDRTHLEELLSVCETQRKIGETSMNETSSRSHQILRLTIESSGREYSPENSATLAASVCFVDLAGSERASQTLSAGTRLKEGCHINRSLLTLGTVIRKLSKGGKSGHIPYRDSKLTRILQNSLGGNARTAIICTMSPARSHVEQSRNTLLFATCAKEVTTNAQVNLVVSEKALVRQLQQELARMENELKNLGSVISPDSDFYSLLKQKEEVIAKMEEQMKELKWQRDVAQSRVENLLKLTTEERSSRMDEHSMLSSMDLDADLRRRSYDSTDLAQTGNINNLPDFLENSEEEDDFLLDDDTPQFSGNNLYDAWEEMARITDQKLEDPCKEVTCIETEGEKSGGQAETHDSLDNIVDKKAVSEAISPRKEETLSAPQYQQSYNSFMGDEKAKNQIMKISTPAEMENVDLLLKTMHVQLSLNANPDKREPTLKNSDMEICPSFEAQETQESLDKEDGKIKKEERKMSPSTKQAEQCSKKDENAESEQQSKEDWELPTKKQSEEIVEVDLMPDGAKLDEYIRSGEKWDNKLHHDTDKYYDESNCKNIEADDINNNTYEALKGKEDWELPTKKQSEGTLEEDLMPDGFKLDVTSGEKWDNKLHQDTIKDYEKSVCKINEADDIDENTYEALKKKVKEMQKKIEYLMTMHTAEQQQSPSFRRDHNSPEFFASKRSRSCRENLLSVRSPYWFETFEANNNTSPGRPISKTSNTSSVSFDSGSTISSTSVDAKSLKESDPETGNSFREFVAGLEEMARQHHSIESTPELDYGNSYVPTRTERLEIKQGSPENSIRGNTNALPNPQNGNEETTDATNDQSAREQANNSVVKAVPKQTDSTEASPEKLQVANGQYSSSSSHFETQQRQIIELWAVCNVPLVHRTYFFLLFKGDPSDFVYMEVELRRLSFLTQTISTDPETSRIQTVKALTREKEWLSKQIPKKFPWSQRIELYQKWGIELNSKQRCLQVAHKLWTNTQEMEHIKESASLVAKLLGFVEQSRIPKEMFGLSLLPGTENIRSSGWRFTKSFSGIRLNG